MKGHIRRRGERSWAIVLDLGPDPETGKRRQKWHSVKGTKKQAEARLTDLLKELKDGAYIEPSKETVAEFFVRWKRDYATPNLRQTTYESYESLIDKHIVPALGHIRLDRLKTTHLQQLYAAKLKDGSRADGRPGGLSVTTVRYMHAIIREALTHAVKWGLVTRNVADAADPPPEIRTEAQVWSPEQTRVFLDSVREDRLYALYLLALTTGMRRGELLGLRWQDVDFDGAAIMVRQSLVHTREGLKIAEPKTPKSRRAVAISPLVVDALRRHRTRQTQERRWFAGEEYSETELVFTNPGGGPIQPRNLARQFERRTAAAGLPRIRLHDMRHTHVTMLLSRGLGHNVAGERVGHSRASTTLDVYGHVLPALSREAAQHAEDAIFRPEGRRELAKQDSPREG